MQAIIDELLDESLCMDEKKRTRLICAALFLDALRAKQNTNDERDRKALSALAETLAADAGAPYQPELTVTK